MDLNTVGTFQRGLQQLSFIAKQFSMTPSQRFTSVAGSATLFALAAFAPVHASTFNFSTPTNTSSPTAERTVDGLKFTLSNPNWTPGLTNGIRTGTEGICVWAQVGSQGGRCDANVSDGFANAVLAGLQGSFDKPTVLKSFYVGQFAPTTMTDASIQFKLGSTVLSTVNITSFGLYSLPSPIVLDAGQTLEMITTSTLPSGNTNGGVFRILSFDAQEVPGPLPLLGSGVAFGFSRKLRRRIQAKVS